MSEKRQSPMTANEGTETAHSLELLRQWLKPGDAVLTITLHRSRGGLETTVGAWAIAKGAHPCKPRTVRLFGHVARVLGRRADFNRGGVVFRGGNYSPQHELVHDLGVALYGDGRAFVPEEL